MVTLLGKGREVTVRGIREAFEVLIMLLDLGAVYTVELSSQKFSKLCTYMYLSYVYYNTSIKKFLS